MKIAIYIEYLPHLLLPYTFRIPVIVYNHLCFVSCCQILKLYEVKYIPRCYIPNFYHSAFTL